MTADNFKFDVQGGPLEVALELASFFHKRVIGWRVDDDKLRLILYWAESKKATPLPAPLEGNAIVEFVRAWLNSVDYGPEPDIDGSVGKGCRVYTEDWGHIDHEYQAFVAIEPYWLMYGK